MSIPASHGQQYLGVLTLANHTHREITDHGRKINLEEPLPFIRVFVQADPV